MNKKQFIQCLRDAAEALEDTTVYFHRYCYPTNMLQDVCSTRGLIWPRAVDGYLYLWPFYSHLEVQVTPLSLDEYQLYFLFVAEALENEG